MSALKNMVGLTFGRLTVVERATNAESGRAVWSCLCSCGNRKDVFGPNLRRGLSQSCGCLRIERSVIASTTHGASKTDLYGAWSHMIGRCENVGSADYPRWGGHGIKVCARWRNSFAHFLADMGPRPSARHSIDRYPNNNGNYEPSNCRWALPTEQARNTLATRLSPELAHEAKTVRDSGGNLSAWAKGHNVSQAVAWYAATGRTWKESRP